MTDRMSIMILSHSTDMGAVILHNHLIKNEIHSRIITDLDLIHAKSWLVKISEYGFHSFFQLEDGENIDPSEFDHIYCRLTGFVFNRFSNNEDNSYASMEFHAMISGLLEFLNNKTINNVHPVYLARTSFNPLLISDNFIRAGIPVIETCYISDKEIFADSGHTPSYFIKGSVLDTPGIIEEPLLKEFSWATVIGGDTIGPLGEVFEAELKNLKMITGLDVFKVYFQRNTKNKWAALYYTETLDFIHQDELNLFTRYVS
jgi:hypothetical protein